MLAIFILLYIDDGVLPFSSRDNMILGTKNCISIIAKFRLIVYTRSKEKSSKTEAMFIPSISILHRWWYSLRISDPSNEQSKESSDIIDYKKHTPNLQAIYKNTNKTDPFEINDIGGYIPFID